MDTGRVLRNSIYLLNEFCADSETFSFKVLPFLKLERLGLRINIESQELIIFISTDPDYQMLRAHLMPEQRLYQLLGIHFKQVQIVFGSKNAPIEKSIYLETISLDSSADLTDLRHPRTLGARLRRALNIVLQGHTVVLWLYDDTDVDSFKQLWVRTRVIQLFEEHKIMHHYDSEKRLVELWRVRCFDEGNGIVITIK